MSAWPAAVAPGKVFLAGEYGVLAGGRALVMAVDRHARLHGDSHRDASSFEAAGLAHLRETGLPLPEQVPSVDARALRDAHGEKLGLGSSAAWAAVVTVSALTAAGRAPSLAERWAIAHAVHRRASGGGSGADVAACLCGGVVRFRRGHEDESPLLEAASLPEAHRPLVIRGPGSVSTARSIEVLTSGGAGALLEDAAEAGDALCAALTGSDPAGLITALRDAARVLATIEARIHPGEARATSLLDAITRALRPFGGVAKPSGASGAELALAYTPAVEPHDRERVRQALHDAGLQVLDLHLEPRGAHLTDQAAGQEE